MNKIAKPCCGSCEHYGEKESINYEGFLECSILEEVVIPLDVCCYNPNEYSPRKPIDNPYKRYKDMWEMLKTSCNNNIEANIFDKKIITAISSVVKTMKTIEEKHK
jgi:hypothetical protein